MRLILLSLVAVAIAVAPPQSALAGPQPKAVTSLSYLDVDPDEAVNAAFSAPYGLLLVAEAATVLGDSADAACLTAKRIEKAAAESARAILLRVGAQMVRKIAGAVDQAAFKAKFAARKGAKAEADLARLSSNPDVRAYLALARPAKLAAVANLVIENFERYALLQRIKLVRPIHPLAGGRNTALLEADPSEDPYDKVDAFVAKNKSAALKRYLELSDAAQEAFTASVNPAEAPRLGPVQLMAGLDKELADVCIGRP
jgi:hypothetical protein